MDRILPGVLSVLYVVIGLGLAELCTDEDDIAMVVTVAWPAVVVIYITYYIVLGCKFVLRWFRNRRG